MLTVKGIKVVEELIKKTPELDVFVKLIKEQQHLDGYSMLPKTPYHEVDFELHNTYSGFANAIRRILVEEMDVICLDTNETHLRTDDEFISGTSDVLMKNIGLLPCNQHINVKDFDKYSIYILKTNKTTDIIPIKASDIIIGTRSEVQKKAAEKLQKDQGDPSLQKPKKESTKKSTKESTKLKKVKVKGGKDETEPEPEESKPDEPSKSTSGQVAAAAAVTTGTVIGSALQGVAEMALGPAAGGFVAATVGNLVGGVLTAVVGGAEDDDEELLKEAAEAEAVAEKSLPQEKVPDEKTPVKKEKKQTVERIKLASRHTMSSIDSDAITHGTFRVTEAILMRAYTEDESSLKALPIEEVIPDTNITIITLRPGKTLYIDDIGFSVGKGKDNSGKYSLLDNVRYRPLNVTPFDMFEGTGTRSIETDPTSFAIGFTTCGNISPKRVIQLVTEQLRKLLLDIRKNIEAYSTIENKKFYSSDEMEVIYRDDTYHYHIRKQYFTAVNMIAQRCFLIDENISLCTAGVERYDTQVGVIRMKHADPNGLLIKAIDECLKDTDTVSSALFSAFGKKE
jgi:hypothetical protein